MEKLKKVLVLFLMVVFISSSMGFVHAQSPVLNQFDLQAMKTKKENSQTKSDLVEGTLKEKGQTVKDSLLLIQSKEKSSKWYYAMTDANGKFQTKMPDGDYTIKATKDFNENWKSSKQSFSIKNGKINGSENGEIHLSSKGKTKKSSNQGEGNIQGVLKDGENGVKAELILFSMVNEYEEDVYFISTNKKGEFSATLPDGEFFLYGISTDQGFYRYELQFSVEGNDVYFNGEKQSSLTITLPPKTHTGKVFDQSKPVENVGVALYRVYNYEEYDDYYHDYEFVEYVFSDKKGQINFRQLEDGNYAMSVFHETFEAWEMINFQVVDGREVTTLDIKLPEVSLKGKIFDGKKPVTQAYLSIEGYSGDEYYWYHTAVDKKGNFEYRLKDGFYTIWYVDEYYRSTHVDITFEILNGQMFQNGKATKSLVIDLPAITLQGQLIDQEHVLAGSVYVEGMSEDGSYSWYHAATDEKGIFSLRLKDGQYQVANGYLYDESEEIFFLTSFEIIDGKLHVDGEPKDLLQLQVPPVSLHGVVMDGEHPVNGGEIIITTGDGEYYLWKWLNDDGSFTMRLADGDYKIHHVYLEDGTNGYVNQAFTIQDGGLFVNGEPQEILTIVIPPITVTGNVYDAGMPVAGDISVIKLDETDEPMYFWSYVNYEGEFGLRLPDGDFLVSNIYLYDGTYVTPAVEFSVQSGQLFINGEKADSLEITVAPINVTGKVYYGNKVVRDGGVFLVSVDEDGEWLDWYGNWVDYDGTYNFRLPDGDYKIIEVDVYPIGHVEVDIAFSIQDGKLIVDGEEADSLDVSL